MAIEEDPPPGVPEWVVTFGDMMSLLLTFFVLLFSMSEVKSSRKFQAMADSLRKQFGHDTSRRSLTPGSYPALNSRLQRLGAEEFAHKENMQNGRSTTPMNPREASRLAVTRERQQPAAGTVVFFEQSSSRLSPQSQEQLRTAAEELTGKANKIAVRGHAVARPPEPGTPYRDDWALAYERCVNTMQFLVTEAGIDRRRFRLEVAGRNEPLHISSDPVLFSRNSRVEVYLLSEMVDEFQGTAAERQQRIYQGDN